MKISRDLTPESGKNLRGPTKHPMGVWRSW